MVVGINKYYILYYFYFGDFLNLISKRNNALCLVLKYIFIVLKLFDLIILLSALVLGLKICTQI